jgi:hypothetical protein
VNGQVVESYDYANAGKVLLKAVQVSKGVTSGTLIGTFSYDNEGKLVHEYLPHPTPLSQTPLKHIQYSYDAMSRPSGVTDYGDYGVNGQPVLNIASNAVWGGRRATAGLLL